MKKKILKFEIFYENLPPTRHTKYKRIDFAHCNKSIMANNRAQLWQLYRALIVPNWSKWQSLNPHIFTKNDHR